MKQNISQNQGFLRASPSSGFYSSVIYEDLQKMKSINFDNNFDFKYFQQCPEHYLQTRNPIGNDTISKMLITQQAECKTMKPSDFKSQCIKVNRDKKRLSKGIQRRHSEIESYVSSRSYRNNNINNLNGMLSQTQRISSNPYNINNNQPNQKGQSRNVLLKGSKTKESTNKTIFLSQKGQFHSTCNCCSGIISANEKHIELLRKLLSKSIKMIKELHDQLKSISSNDIILSPLLIDSLTKSAKIEEAFSVDHAQFDRNFEKNYNRKDSKTVYLKNKRKLFNLENIENECQENESSLKDSRNHQNCESEFNDFNNIYNNYNNNNKQGSIKHGIVNQKMARSNIVNENPFSKIQLNKEGELIEQNKIQKNVYKAEELPINSIFLKEKMNDQFFKDHQLSSGFENIENAISEVSKSKTSKKRQLDNIINNLEDAMKIFIEQFKALNHENPV